MYQLLQLFPSQVLKVTWPQAQRLNPALIAEVLALRNQLPSVSKTNVGGWHSPSVLQERNEPALREFTDAIPAHLVGLGATIFCARDAARPGFMANGNLGELQ